MSRQLLVYSTIRDYPWGGADAMWTAAAREALADGWSVDLLLGPLTAESAQVRALAAAGAGIVPCPPPPSGLTARIARRLGMDLDDAALEAMRAAPGAHVLVSQGGSFECAFDRFVAALVKTARSFDLLCNQQDEGPRLTADERARVERAYAAARHVVFVSERNREATERALARSVPNALVLQYPVCAELDAPFAWPEGTGRMAFVGRYDAYDKGLDILVPALAAAFPRGGDWSLTLFGRGRDEDYVRALAARYPALRDHVSFGGFAAIEDIWRSHHLLVLPSRREGASLAMTEALLRGRPVLATDVGGAGEWIDDARSGFLCAAPTVPLLAETLGRAWQWREGWMDMGLHAYADSRARYRPRDYRRLLEGLERAGGKAAFA